MPAGSMFELRTYQKELAEKGLAIMRQFGLVYLAMQPRTGKTLTAMKLADLYGAKRVLFITKLKAIPSIEGDYLKFNPSFSIKVWNYESLHKLTWDFDLVICDEAHCLSSFAKPAQRTKALREKVWNLPIIYLSATPTAESYSQIYHQFWISKNSPFARYKNFYLWARDYVNIKKKFINGWQINDYSSAKEAEVKQAIIPYLLHLSQEEAGFTSFIEEEILWVPIDKRLYKLMDILKKDKVYTMKNGDTIIADTPAKLQSCFHQISSGSIKIDEEKRYTLDESKAYFIRSKFAGKKIAIFYQFIQEGVILRNVFPENTSSPEEFNANPNMTFICQYSSGKEGTNVSTADCLIGYNIGFSATTYWQFRERMQTKDRIKSSKLYWPFSEHGIEKEIHKAVLKKKNFTLNYFKKVYQIK
jgi:superfamily II DNA or RNA helicase